MPDLRESRPAPIRIAAAIALATPFLTLLAVPGFFFPFVTTRTVAFRLLIGAAFVCIVFALLLRETVFAPRDPLLLALAVFVGALTLSALVGVAPYRSLFGNMERMWGAWGWFHFLLFYFALRTAFTDRNWLLAVDITLGIAAYSSLYALLQWLQLPLPPPFIPSPGRPSATFGNPAYFAAFAYLAIGLAVWRLQVANAAATRWRLSLAIALIFIGFALANTRSALIALVLAAVWCCVWWFVTGDPHARRRMLTIAGGGAICAALLVALAFMDPTHPLVDALPLLDRLAASGIGSANETIRLVAWRAAWLTFLENPVLGIGFENFIIAFDRHYPPTYPLLNGGLMDRSHSAYLELLATTGILGFVAFLGVFCVVFLMLARGVRAGRLARSEAIVLSGTVLGYLAYLAFWFEDINSLLLFVLVLALAATRARGEALVAFHETRTRSPARMVVAAAVTLVFGAGWYVHGYRPLAAARALHEIERAGHDPTQFPLDRYRSALASDNGRAQVIGLMASGLREYAGDMAAVRANPALRQQLDVATTFAIREAEREVTRDQFNSLLWADLGNLYIFGALLTGRGDLFEVGLQHLRFAIDNSPMQVRHRHRLADAYRLIGRSEPALAQLDTSKAVLPEFGESDHFRARMLLDMGDVEGAFTAEQNALALRYAREPRFMLRLERSAATAGIDIDRRIGLLHSFLVTLRGSLGLGTAVVDPVGLAPQHREVIARLADLQREAGHTVNADFTDALLAADTLAGTY